MTKTLICLTIIKNNALLETFRRNPRKREEGDRRSGFERYFKDTGGKGKRKFSRQKLTHVLSKNRC